MRLRLFLFVACCALTALAAPQPLTLKEVSLMLRSGYSSQNVLREIQQRRVIEPLDAATRKSLVSFGASTELLSALDSGSYRVDEATAEKARETAQVAAANQEQAAEKAFRSATEVLREQRARAANTVPTGTPLLTALKDKLVVCRDGAITPADPSATENKKLIAFYYSAHWCAPCRKFTPQLVDYYNRIAPQHPEFQLVFVSFDRSRFNWETYMRETKMPWLALDYDQVASQAGLRNLGGESIPSLLVLDDTGHVVASSYEGERYVGPQNALATLDKIFAAKAVAQAR